MATPELNSQQQFKNFSTKNKNYFKEADFFKKEEFNSAKLNLFKKADYFKGTNKDKQQVQQPNVSIFDKIQEQRHRQREKLFNFAVRLTWSCFIFLILIVLSQMASQVFIKRDLLTGYELQILSVAVFGQIIAIIGIITKSIWDDRVYSGVLGKDHAHKHEKD